ncbi:hypothetical protein [Sciscionella sediminilitoris]|uniref:hypothetical protein n=1 Tax=Sciscionella sediminilitoris TaxID=1445613 RepID=UPI00068AA712|nr:hypothetical protein [Sciscionella sp. SE31]
MSFYHPGGTVAFRLVPRGWYSLPWWRDAARFGYWSNTATGIYSALFQDMPGIPDVKAWKKGAGADPEDDPFDEVRDW